MGVVWLLDFDGVLNAPRAGWSRAPAGATVHALGQAWRIRWEPQAARTVADLANGGVDVRWATTWIGYTQQLELQLGLPELRPAFVLDDGRTDHTQEVVRPLKLKAALAVVREGHRLIWTDDDAMPASGPERDELEAADALLIEPRSNRGLRPEHIDRIRAFAKEST